MLNIRKRREKWEVEWTKPFTEIYRAEILKNRGVNITGKTRNDYKGCLSEVKAEGMQNDKSVLLHALCRKNGDHFN